MITGRTTCMCVSKGETTNSLALVLSSTIFNEDDYIRDYDEYVEYRKQKA